MAAGASAKMGPLARGLVTPASPVYALVLLAEISGAFNISEAFLTAIKKDKSAIQKAQKENDLFTKAPSIFASLVAIAFMEVVCEKDKAEWNLLAIKTKKWVIAELKKTASADSYDSLLELAKGLFRVGSSSK